MPSHAELLTACFRVLLDREPDPVALAAWAGDESVPFDLQAILGVIVHSEEFRGKHAAIAPATDEAASRFLNDQSQFGEIELLLRRMVNAAAIRQIVVDVGANGRARSNSYDLMRHFGWRGLLIEANPGRNTAILEEFAGLNFELVNLAVSDHAGEATFHLGVNDDVSSLAAETAALWGPIQGAIQVKVERLPVILASHDIPKDFDLLSVDAEGEDVRILNDTVAAGYLPRWVIIEASYDMTISALDQLPLNEHVKTRYEIADRTVANLILSLRNPP